MTGPALAMMMLAILVVWGGLALAILNLVRYKGDEPDQVRRDL